MSLARRATPAVICAAILWLAAGLFSPLPAQAGVATLYRGNDTLGEIPAMDGKGGFVISVADAAALLGLEASVSGEELVLGKNKDQLRLVLDAVAAWHNTQLIPLYTATYVQDGRWWLDPSSLLGLLQRVAGKGTANRLRVEETQAQAQKTSSPPPIDPLQPTAGTAPTQTDTQPSKTEKSDPVRVVVVSEPISQPPTTTKQETEVPAAKAPEIPASAAPGTIRALRWSTTREKVRAVIDCTDGTDHQMRAEPGKITLNFAGALENLQGVPSPYENVAVSMTREAKGVTLVFTAQSQKVEKLVLDNPRRVVLDFTFASAATIKETPVPETVPTEVAGVGHREPRKNGRPMVVLDPGHGGKDPGAVGNGIKEKDINLAVGLKLEKALKAKGLDVYMTRRTDVYLKLQERTDIAHQKNADMFVSIHVNSLPPGKNSAGFEIYLMAMPTDKDALALAKIENQEYVEGKANGGGGGDERTERLLKIIGEMLQYQKIDESTAAAESLFKSGNSAGLPMKRVAQAPFFVLRGAGCPAVLLEMGFITNAKEAKLLAHSGYQQKIADAMADGIHKYLK